MRQAEEKSTTQVKLNHLIQHESRLQFNSKKNHASLSYECTTHIEGHSHR